MEQYIPKAAVLAEIERRIKERDNQMKSGCWVSSAYIYEDLLDFLDTLEVKVVDLDIELSYEDYIGFFNEHPNFPNDWGFDEAWIFAKYFYELGLNAMKG